MYDSFDSTYQVKIELTSAFGYTKTVLYADQKAVQIKPTKRGGALTWGMQATSEKS